MDDDEIRELFHKLDKDHNGSIDREEFILGLRELHLPTDPTIVQRFFEEADDNHDQQVSQEEFLHFMKHRRASLRQLFDQLDVNKDGVISEEEIGILLKSAGFKADKKHVMALLHTADHGRKNSLDFHEFSRFLSLLPSTGVQDLLSVWTRAVAIDIGEDFTLPPDHVNKDMHSIMLYLLAGGVAGMVSRTATSPLDRLKIIMQTAVDREPILKAFLRIYETEGVRGYWRGNLANVIKIFPESGIRFVSYETYKRYLFPEHDPIKLSAFEKLLAGGLAGATSQISIYPMEVIRARLAVSSPGTYSGIRDVFATTLRREGPAAFYKGLVPSLIGIFPYAAIDFAIYDALKKWYVERKKSQVKEKTDQGLSVWVLLSCGAVSSSIGQLASYPMDLVRRRLQIQGMKAHTGDGLALKALGPMGILRETIQKEGPLGLYRGMVPNLMKVVPSMAISYADRMSCFGTLSSSFRRVSLTTPEVSQIHKQRRIYFTERVCIPDVVAANIHPSSSITMTGHHHHHDHHHHHHDHHHHGHHENPLAVLEGHVRIRSAHGEYLSAREDGCVKQVSNRENWERWTPEHAGHGLYYLRSDHGKFLSARQDKTVSQVHQAEDWEKWYITPLEHGKFSLRSAHGHHLRAGDHHEHHHVNQADGHSVGAWEQWTIERA
ncbi:putative small calcium-binding mitochondrial carrier [Planoprotostelium fungivorum]|uniref:Putative small calcium-binding mitochondrial carrier n=1 Tax=Planoprotostelium fungivorum TaxID=1890364 RepID=A0A2P6MV54_9EUKA|nr:putative small calcium-binding mitochondrial carrier [Planoprotostelium fungivorum]